VAVLSTTGKGIDVSVAIRVVVAHIFSSAQIVMWKRVIVREDTMEECFLCCLTSAGYDVPPLLKICPDRYRDGGNIDHVDEPRVALAPENAFLAYFMVPEDRCEGRTFYIFYYTFIPLSSTFVLFGFFFYCSSTFYN